MTGICQPHRSVVPSLNVSTSHEHFAGARQTNPDHSTQGSKAIHHQPTGGNHGTVL